MSSKRRQRRKGCTGKVRYADLSSAWRAVRSIERNCGPQSKPIAPYRCSTCGHLHVGHTPLAKRRADVAAGRALPPNRRAW